MSTYTIAVHCMWWHHSFVRCAGIDPKWIGSVRFKWNDKSAGNIIWIIWRKRFIDLINCVQVEYGTTIRIYCGINLIMVEIMRRRYWCWHGVDGVRGWSTHIEWCLQWNLIVVHTENYLDNRIIAVRMKFITFKLITFITEPTMACLLLQNRTIIFYSILKYITPWPEFLQLWNGAQANEACFSLKDFSSRRTFCFDEQFNLQRIQPTYTGRHSWNEWNIHSKKPWSHE